VIEQSHCHGITCLNYRKEESIVKLDPLAFVSPGCLGGCLVSLPISGGPGGKSFLGHARVHFCKCLGCHHGVDAGYFSGPRCSPGHGISCFIVVDGHRQFSGMGVAFAIGLGHLDLSHACLA